MLTVCNKGMVSGLDASAVVDGATGTDVCEPSVSCPGDFIVRGTGFDSGASVVAEGGAAGCVHANDDSGAVATVYLGTILATAMLFPEIKCTLSYT